MNCQNCAYAALFEGNAESCKRDDFGHDSNDIGDEESISESPSKIKRSKQSEEGDVNGEIESESDSPKIKPSKKRDIGEVNGKSESESESESEGEGEQHHGEPLDDESESESERGSNSAEIEKDDDATRKKKTEEWMKLVEGIKAKRPILQSELDLQNVQWCLSDTVEKLVARLVNAEMGQSKIREKQKKRRRDPLGKYFDQEAQVRESADGDHKDEVEEEDIDHYSFDSPGNSQDKDFVAGVTTSDSPSKIVYVCPVTGKGIQGEQRVPKSSRFDDLNKAIRRWMMECTNEALSARREDLIFSLQQIKLSITESLNMNLIDDISARQLKTKVADGMNQ